MTGPEHARGAGVSVPAAAVVDVSGPLARRARTALAPLLTACAAVVALAVGTGSGAARVVLHQCVRLDEPLALLGVRLTLLQDAADCPTGTLAVAAAPTHGAVLALGLVLPVVAAHTALGALGAGLTALLVRIAGTVRRLVESVVHVLPRAATAQPVRVGRTARAWTTTWSLPSRIARDLHPHRGPPVALA